MSGEIPFNPEEEENRKKEIEAFIEATLDSEEEILVGPLMSVKEFIEYHKQVRAELIARGEIEETEEEFEENERETYQIDEKEAVEEPLTPLYIRMPQILEDMNFSKIVKAWSEGKLSFKELAEMGELSSVYSEVGERLDSYRESVDDAVDLAETMNEMGEEARYSISQMDLDLGLDPELRQDITLSRRIITKLIFERLGVTAKERSYYWGEDKVVVYKTNRPGVSVRKIQYGDGGPSEIEITSEIMPDEEDPKNIVKVRK